MKRMIKAATGGVTLKVRFESYERYSRGRNMTITVSGTDLLDALCNMCDEMRLYLDGDEIREEGMTPEEVIESIETSNGDGCDYIYYIKDLTNKKTLLEGYADEEDD